MNWNNLFRHPVISIHLRPRYFNARDATSSGSIAHGVTTVPAFFWKLVLVGPGKSTMMSSLLFLDSHRKASPKYSSKALHEVYTALIPSGEATLTEEVRMMAPTFFASIFG
ncbi:MAG: hypothetical protein RBG13Loki_3333 [Promethearchaeota archaeon CR_4]|nr:MAG: hypothetical protein RBG13Loki_3333 [Candidatus Lokiarchaeota archaeon CR_4]